MQKIRTLIAHNYTDVTNNIIKAMKDMNYVEVGGTATNGTETYNKIVDLKPEMVFVEFNIDSMNSLEIIEKAKESLNEQTPVFNIITNKEISDEDMQRAYNMIGRKMNSFVSEPVEDSIIDNIMKNYKEHKEIK